MKASTQYQNIKDECERHLSHGRFDLVKAQLSEISPSKVPRAWRLPLAYISRRANLPAMGLKLLAPLIRPTESVDAPDATPSEKTEYAVLLQRSGANHEALELLKALDPNQTPEVRIARVHCYFGMWDYERAIPELKAYLLQPQTPFLATVSRLNLAAALVALGRFDEAPELIEQVISEAKSLGIEKLQGNAFELLAQIHVSRNDRALAMEVLLAAALKFGADNSLDMLFVEKWRAVLDAKQSGSIEPIIGVRKKALAFRHWETVRDCDLRALTVRFDDDLFRHLYFGTPYASYRNKLKAFLARTPTEPYYLFGSTTAPYLDLEEAVIIENSETSAQREPLQKGGKIHQLLEILSRDFYRPLSVGGIFAELFSGEYFDIHSSPNRVNQIIIRARKWAAQNGLPLSLNVSDGSVSLVLHENFAIRIPLERRSLDPYSSYLEILRRQFGEDTFSAAKGGQALGLSPSGFRRFAQWALDNGHLDMYGASKSTVYYLKPPQAA